MVAQDSQVRKKVRKQKKNLENPLSSIGQSVGKMIFILWLAPGDNFVFLRKTYLLTPDETRVDNM